MAISDEQVNHGMVRGDFGFEIALLIFLSASDLSAQVFDNADGFFKGEPRLSRILKRAMSLAGSETNLSEPIGIANLARNDSRTVGKVQRLRVLALFLVNIADETEG